MKPAEWLRSLVKYFSSSISNKIIIPYALLTVILAAFGVFVVTQLVASSFEDRLKNQLLEAGQVVSDEVVNRERFRLEEERAVANTIGVAEALVNRNFRKLDELVAPIIANAQGIDSIVMVDTQGKEVLRLQRESVANGTPVQTDEDSGADFSGWIAVARVLADPQGNVKEVQLARDPKSNELIIYTVGPVQTTDGIVGAALVGTYLHKEIRALQRLALADVTLFDQTANVMATTLSLDQEEYSETFGIFTPDRYQQVLAEKDVTLLDEVDGPQDIETGSQTYRLAYAPFVLRGRVYGVFAVALPTNFVTDTNTASRNQLALIFSIGVIAVFGVGYFVSRRIIQPIVRLVQTSRAIAQGDLTRRANLKLEDEIGILANTFDSMTSELQRLLKIQEEEASKLNAILSSIADGVIVLDATGGSLITNPAAASILESVGDDFAFLSRQESNSQVTPSEEEEQSSQLLSSLTGLQFHETRRYEIGQRVLSALSAPVVTSEGEQLGSVVVLRDITREFEAEKLKDDFITNISHELRTPLAAIKGYNDLLRMTGGRKLDQRQLEFITKIEDNLADLQNLIQEMLDLSQIEAGTLGIDHEPLNLTELINIEVQKWVEEMRAKDLSFNFQLTDEPLIVEGDWNRLTRVVHNLLKNAHDYTLPGGKVVISLKQSNDRAQVDVNDTGVGIAEEDRRFLFTRFFRAIHEESTYDISGAGLGLYISKAIVEAHHGEIWLKTELNRGSTFSFALPIIDSKKKVDLETRPVEYVET